MESQASGHPPSAPTLRFTILRHERPVEPHWDLLLEISGQDPLLAWQIRESPDQWPGQTLTARRLPDHRRIYLDYEGPLSNDRGHVTRYDTGVIAWTEFTTTEARFTLQGARLRIAIRASGTGADLWSLIVSPLSPVP